VLSILTMDAASSLGVDSIGRSLPGLVGAAAELEERRWLARSGRKLICLRNGGYSAVSAQAQMRNLKLQAYGLLSEGYFALMALNRFNLPTNNFRRPHQSWLDD